MSYRKFKPLISAVREITAFRLLVAHRVLFADRAEHLQQRGMLRQNALMLVATRTAVPLEGEWVEALAQ